ncbi:Uncharacterized conserved protein [Listeria grayi]|uniref:Glycosyl hydrolase n=1 Tax=Listeria grayi FSL F6-1183 TaxID=1265827 RepID=A0A829RBI2_LISGR|nr:glycoside hydrolase family 125 protein [Listeria grayi]EUJ30383.1 hypothetical protein LMUR_00845 [Listeria grayi FSL F6-1183]VEI31091.1 Uncharacterized conserved protein [Listeria grayi]
MAYQEVPTAVKNFMQTITEKCGTAHADWAKNFNACFANTLLTTIKRLPDETTFVLTGDIPAMWLRDSTAQVRPYLVVAKEDAEIAKMIAGLVERQMQFICLDPYANAFNETANGAGHQTDHTEKLPEIWERKYEIDSLCYPVQLSYLLYKATGDTSHFNATFEQAVDKILAVWETEQHHENSPYRFVRDTDRKEDTLVEDGVGSKVAWTGMTWSGFRPSDDACIYGYLVPSNMFAIVVLDYLREIFTTILPSEQKTAQIKQLRDEIEKGIKTYGVTTSETGEKIYAYEVDGKGSAKIMDDSNVPNLLSAPYLGYCDADDPLYLATRKVITSKENPYFYEGEYAKGIGSSHTPPEYIWPIALAMEGMTTTSKAEKERILNTLVACDGGTNLMHEGFDVNNPNNYTREWFSWANMMFCELVMDYFDIQIQK